MNRPAAILLPLLWLVLLVGALKLSGYLAVVAGDRGVILLLLVLWVPLAAVLFWRARRRRAVALAAYLSEKSGWRQRLRGGVWMGILQSAAALPLAIVLLVVISQPQNAAFWWWLMFAAPLWLGMWTLSQRLLRHDVNPLLLSHAAGALATRTAGVLLVLMILLVSLWTPVPDLSSLNLLQAVRLGMSEASGESPLLLAAARGWHAMSWARLWLVQQVADGSLPTLLALLAWVLLLVQGALFVWPVLLQMQGISLLHEPGSLPVPLARRLAALSSATPAVAATAGIATLLVVWCVLAPRPLGWLFGVPQLVQLGGVTYAVPANRLDRILAENAAWLDHAQTAQARELGQLAEAELDRLFADARSRVPAYADWHYSLTGGVTRTAVRLMEYFSADNTRAVRMLSERLFPTDVWQQKLLAFEQTTNDAYVRQLQELHDATLEDLQRRLTGREAHPHWQIDAGSLINLDELATSLKESGIRSDLAMRQSGVSAALGTGAAAVTLTRSVRAATQARAAQGAARVGARAAGRGTASGSATLCAASGPLALGCAVVVFTGVTLASEYAILKADERLSRQQLEADLLTSIDAMRDAIGEVYLGELLAALREDAGHIHAGIIGRVRPVDSLQTGNSDDRTKP